MPSGYPNAEQDLLRLRDIEDREEQVRGIIDGLQLMGEQIRYQFRHAEDNGLAEKVRKQAETQASINAALEQQIEQESGVLLYLDSTRGTIFKNDTAQTTITVVIYKRGERITNATRLHLVFGPDAYLRWSMQEEGDSSFVIIPSSDSRIGSDGFSLTVSAADVDSSVVFRCELIDEGATRTESQITIAKVLDGSSAVGIDAMSVYYLLQGSALTPPAKPTTNPPGGNWTLTEPGYTAGSTNSLYTVFLTIYSDDSFDYSEVCLSSSYEAAKAAYNKASEVETSVTNLRTSASAEEQLIYITKPSGTLDVNPTTTWVEYSGENPETWTLKRPTYNRSYPVLFIAKQRKNVAGTVTCTTPLKDDTTTIIDGGHITTGEIDASRVTVTKLNASNITSGTLSADRIAANSIAVAKLSGTISNNGWSINLNNGTLTIGNISANNITSGALVVKDANNNIIFQADKDTKTVKIADWTANKNYLSSPYSADNTQELQIGGGIIAFKSTTKSGLTAIIPLRNAHTSTVDNTGLYIALFESPSNAVYSGELQIFGQNGSGTIIPYGMTTNNNSGTNHYITGKLHFTGDETVEIAHPAVWRTALGAVNKAGDTMTGNLTISKSGGESDLHTKRTDMDITVAPSAYSWAGAVTFRDKNDLNYGYVGAAQSAARTSEITLLARNYVNNTAYDNSLKLGVSGGGVRSVVLTHPFAWHDALGLSNSVTNTVLKSSGSLSSGTWTALNAVTFAAGTWIIVYHCEFGSNATGRRCICFATTTPSASAANDTGTQVPAVNGSKTIISFMKIITVSANTTYYFSAYQNSGSALTVNANVEYLRFTL